MKLIIAIVNRDDSSEVSDALMKSGFFATKLASTGSFLMAGNTTFLVCTEEEKVSKAISVIGEHSKKRTQLIPATGYTNPETYVATPIEVTVGGATIIVLDVEQFMKI